MSHLSSLAKLPIKLSTAKCNLQIRNQILRRRDFLKGIPPMISIFTRNPSQAREVEVEVGSYLPPFLSDSFVIGFKEAPILRLESGFSYDGETGPDKWGSLNPSFHACSIGRTQSPIDISNRSAVPNPKLEPLSTNYKDASATLVNNGFNIEVNFENGVGSEILFGKIYDLKRMHWHAPSEHLLDGVRFDAELHLVHASTDGSIAVTAILHRYGAPDPVLSQINNQVVQMAKEAAEASIPINVIKMQDLQQSTEGKYMRYAGSLTTPPCTEKVIWTVMEQVREISKEQVDAIKAPLDQSCKANSRPTQPLNDRYIELSQL